MVRTENEKQYQAVMGRIEELLPVVDDNTPTDDRNAVELVLLSNLAADYDDVQFPIKTPSLSSVLRQRMYELGLTQKEPAARLDVSPARLSEYITGKREPTLSVARMLAKNLSIAPEIVLGM